MKNYLLLLGAIIIPVIFHAQVGIGTTTPNPKSILEISSTTKGLLIPRMTASQRANIQPSSAEAGMMIYQITNDPKGIYTHDGSSWRYHAPIEAASLVGQTPRWDGSKWVPQSNLFNQGTAVGIGIQSPSGLLHVHGNSIPVVKVQITNGHTGTTGTDGLIIGTENSNSNHPGAAHIMQQETEPLWIGTSGLERLRINADGEVGINTQEPTATLHVNGTVRIGNEGTALSCIKKWSEEIDLPSASSGAEWSATFDCPGATMTDVVYASPGANPQGWMVAYSRVSGANTVEVKFTNMSEGGSDPAPMMLHIALIQ